MKYLLSFLLIFSFAPVMSQTDNGVLMNQVLVDSVHRRYNPSLGKMVYRIKLDLINNDKRIIKGFLYQTKDSSIVLYDPIGVINRTSSINKNFEYRTWSVDVNRINTLEYRRNNSVGQAAGIGAAIGFAAGSSLYLIDYSDLISPKIKFFVYTIPLTMAGTIIGVFIGKKYNYIKIEGKKTIYDNYKKELKAFSVLD